MPKYFCDYCDTYLTHDSPSVRKTHCSGRKHKENVKFYYQKWMEEQAQHLIDATTAAFKAGKLPHAAGVAIPPPGHPAAMPPGMPPMGPMGPMGGPPRGKLRLKRLHPNVSLNLLSLPRYDGHASPGNAAGNAPWYADARHARNALPHGHARDETGNAHGRTTLPWRTHDVWAEMSFNYCFNTISCKLWLL